ncbi:MAG TPA: orotidine-5'-phosphate decarboxylase [Candidatus Parcubacteria bacterium]|nr:orotidine-5'-phosphate decarboxylase [Candidatus Parcubacteria bacterium]
MEAKERAAEERVIVALDVDNLSEALELASKLKPYIWGVKVGLQLLTVVGAPKAVSALKQLGLRVFFDGKFCDIPNTVAAASKAASDLGVDMFNVHVSCGAKSLLAAAENKGNAKVLGVTVLTSLGEKGCLSIFGVRPKEKVLHFTKMALACGLDGIICSPQELEMLSLEEGFSSFLKVVPGVRPSWALKGDQKRVMTPEKAILAGADYLVIGRPITQPPKEIGGPLEAVQMINQEIDQALVKKIFKKKQAVWFYGKEKEEPHAVLTSGKHSDGYINLSLVLKSPCLSQILAAMLIKKLKRENISLKKVNAVVSSSYAAICFGYEVARQLGVDFVFTEKKEDGGQRWSERFELPSNAVLLHVEELITTLKTTQEVEKAILAFYPEAEFLKVNDKPLVAAIVYRPENLSIKGTHEIVSLIETEIHSWEPENCPLCQSGSSALKPKENWKAFFE